MSKPHLGRVIFWMTGALLCFSTIALSVRELGSKLNVFEILSIRSATGVIFLLLLAAFRPELRRHLVPRSMPLHLLRNTVHFGAQAGWSQAVLLLPLATVFSLEFTCPLWTTLLAVVALGERLTTSRVGAVLLGFLGMLVIVRPGFAGFQPAALLVLGAAIGFAITLVVTKKLTATDSTFAILFWMSVIQLPLNLAGSDLAFPLKLGAGDLWPVLGIMIAGLASHYCLTNAFRWGDATIVVPIDFLRIPLIAVVGWLFYGEDVDMLVMLGAALIISGIVWNLLDEARRRPMQ